VPRHHPHEFQPLPGLQQSNWCELRKAFSSATIMKAACSILIVGLLLATGFAVAQDWTIWLGPSGGPRLRARLTDKSQNAAQHVAVVEVEAANVFLHESNLVTENGIQVGLLRYRIDHDPAVLTTQTHLIFQEIPSGPHTISVALIAPDHRLLAPEAKLELTIP
jgi:hypothetical protein